MQRILKVLNHNALLTHDYTSNQLLLVLHNGIGFKRKVGEVIECDNSIQTYVLSKNTVRGQSYELVNRLDPVYLDISSEIISYVEQTFKKADFNMLLPLADHISFLNKRVASGIVITNPFVKELKALYPDEFECALYAKKCIEAKCNIEINDDELGYLTLHVHSCIGDHIDQSLLIATVVNESIQEVANQFSIDFDQDSVSYSRLLTHLKYLLIRIKEKEELKLDMDEYTKTNYPKAYQVACVIKKRIETLLKCSIPDQEIGYLALHIERICSI